jgi:hypothetical protein
MQKERNRKLIVDRLHSVIFYYNNKGRRNRIFVYLCGRIGEDAPTVTSDTLTKMELKSSVTAKNEYSKKL